ncbi:Sodium/solute symporter, subgroup [Rhodopirellula baltica SH28]|uniref:Sodium/solute symporter, subgroup n=1 Tax=Rhodopirellula baltica SH28 TaxID=993517 RepID=K5EDI2_RHOBT|nr:sodium/solute symporter [Rhodopirellula baltica]EKK03941.1 Sodium/solute symporter, subgroup [Rhodopirellula baltica SH28]
MIHRRPLHPRCRTEQSPFITRSLLAICFAISMMAISPEITCAQTVTDEWLKWSELPPIPNSLGVAGPFVGVDEDALIVAGGANFPSPIWETDKVWHDAVYVLPRVSGNLPEDGVQWIEAGKLQRPTAYGASVSIPSTESVHHGVLCLGGNDSNATFRDVYLLRWNPTMRTVEQVDFPALPQPCVHASAQLIGQTVYLVGGQSGGELSTASSRMWALDLSQSDDPALLAWTPLADCPGPSRAFHVTAAQHDGYETCLYVFSGRRQTQSGVDFLTDNWAYRPSTNTWHQKADVPQSVTAGTATHIGQSHIVVLGGDDGSMFGQADQLKDDHPGFAKKTFAYHTITDTWTEAGTSPANHVTTTAVHWGNEIIVASGEVRPRVRSPAVYQITLANSERSFGTLNYLVLFAYLFSMLGVGVYFARRNRTTDDYFRGGSQIPWWAAGCSIFATMLSSVTFTGIPSKSYAQDWTYSIGNFTIPLVAFIAVYVAMPFFRRIDATSAYEYLEKRFNRVVRWFGSLSFSLFHLFRMAVVMSLTGLALSVATPLTPSQAVLLMGGLSIVYCTLGGIEAVIWTDTIQTVVLLGGAFLAIVLMVLGTDGGFGGSLDHAIDADKMRIANLHFSPTHAQIALWVIVVGAIGQNLSSYTADQAVVQRYMTTASPSLAARSIWTNAVLTIPATLLFFGIGTALHGFYHSHPERLSLAITTDQVFPLFIAREMPIGLAGLIVAGVFAAAQSTVSTSMNSTATALVTDFFRPLKLCRNERGYLIAARTLTFSLGVLGTLLGLVFVDPSIKSLFDTFIVVIGLFMGVLGGLFVLGGLTTRANSIGAMVGATVGAATMFSLWRYTDVNGYLYTTCGITSCFASGYLASLLTSPPKDSLVGLTIHTLDASATDESAEN